MIAQPTPRPGETLAQFAPRSAAWFGAEARRRTLEANALLTKAFGKKDKA